jgi:hypothetical protein
MCGPGAAIGTSGAKWRDGVVYRAIMSCRLRKGHALRYFALRAHRCGIGTSWTFIAIETEV